MNEKDTKKFVKLWNKANNMPDGLTMEENMRYVSPGVVTWNIYDAPRLNLDEVAELLMATNSKGGSK